MPWYVRPQDHPKIDLDNFTWQKLPTNTFKIKSSKEKRREPEDHPIGSWTTSNLHTTTWYKVECLWSNNTCQNSTHCRVGIPASCDPLASHASPNIVFQIGIWESTFSDSHWHPAEISPEVHCFILRLKSKSKGTWCSLTESPIYLPSFHSSCEHNKCHPTRNSLSRARLSSITLTETNLFVCINNLISSDALQFGGPPHLHPASRSTP